MYRLDRMEIHGFKSFYDRTEVSFPVRITGVVGPNGCGKSNISDAIHWVLGEQRVRTLRGEKMEDVIFNGSERRKPLGLAEVSLFLVLDPNAAPLPAFDLEPAPEPAGPPEAPAVDEGPQSLVSIPAEIGGNGAGPGPDPGNGNGADDAGPGPHPGNGNGHDGGEAAGPEALAALDAGSWPESIRITRRLFRDGQSDYLIDGARCRLRDVQDLLRRVAVGSGASAIIEQGKVEQIVASKPKDRRVLIEEAAGIAGFKAKKREATLKLEATEANLVRLEDILGEVRRQINSTKRQAAKARRYRRLMEERRHLERISYRQRGEDLAARLAALQEQRRQVEDEESAGAARLAEAEAAAERLRAEVDEGDRVLTELRDAVHALDLLVDREERAVTTARRQAEEMRVAAAAASAEGQDLEGRSGRALEEAAERERQAGSLAGELRELATEVDAREAELGAGRAEAQAMEAALEGRRGALLELLERVAAMKGELSRLEQDRSRAAAAADRASAEAGEAVEELGRLARQRAELEAEEAAAAGRIAMLEIAIRDWDSEAEGLREDLAGCEARGEAARHQRVTHAERLDALLALEREQSAQGRAARAAGGESGGVVADFVQPPADLEEAVEAYLADLLPAVLVADDGAARRALGRLREAGEGRASFLLPLPAAAAEPLPAELGADPRVRGRLAELLGAGGPAAEAVRAAADGAVVVDDLEAALDLARRYPQRSFLTAGGDVVRPGGLVSGGRTADPTGGILALRRRIQDAREGARRAEAEAAAEAAAAAGHRERLAMLESRRAEAARERAGLEVAVAGRSERRRSLEEMLERTTRFQEVRLAEAQKERADQGSSIEEIGRMAAGLAALEASRAGQEEALRGSAAAVERQREMVARAGEEQAARRSRLDGAHARLEGITAEAGRMRDAAVELADRARRFRDEAAQRLGSAEDLEDLARRSEASLRQNLERREIEQRRLAEEGERLARLREQSAARHAEAKGLAAGLEEVRGRRTQIEVQQSRAESERDYLEQACRNDLDQSLAEAAAAVPDEEARRGADEVAQALSDVRARIEALGPVNVMAMEEFTQLEDRYRFLSTQQKDLQDSIRSLRDTITRINRRSRERFLGAFEQIRANFSEIYRVLFGGGRADLHLEEEVEDVLECGVEIIAQPPGKRLQRIGLLSGGEKALTAISLLFAIFRFRPSPFCVLDEVDAPLDEVNIHRYTELLKRMSDETQFVLITHNKRTMEKAEVLYGVTMQEPGVSRLVSVRFAGDGRLAAEDGSGEIDLERGPARRAPAVAPPVSA